MAQSCHPSGTVVPSKWHSRAIQVAQSCHPSGTAVPSVWHSCAIKVAQPCPRDGKRGCKNEKNGGFAIFPGKK